MKALWLVTVPLLAFSLFVVIKTRPATACATGCSTAVVELTGQYCTDKTGGQVFVADGAPTPDGVRCGAAAASPSPSTAASAAPSASPAASTAASASPAASPRPSASASAAPSASSSAAPTASPAASPSAAPTGSPSAASAPATGTGATAVTNPTAGTTVTETIKPSRTRADYQQVTVVVNGRYCQDKTGGVVFVPAGSPKPDGVTC